MNDHGDHPLIHDNSDDDATGPGRARPAGVRAVPRHARHLDRERRAALDPVRARLRSGGRDLGRECLRPRLCGAAAAVGPGRRPVRSPPRLRRRGVPLHGRNPPRGSGGDQGAVDPGPRRPGDRCRRPESGGHVPVARHLPGGTTRPGDGGVGCCVDAGWSHRRRERGSARRHRGLAGRVPGDRSGVPGRHCPGPASAGGGRAGCPTYRRLGGRRRCDRGGDHPRARCCRCRRPRLDLPAGRRTVRRLVGPDGGVHRHRAPGRGPAGPSRALPVAHAAQRNCRRAARRGVPRLDLRPGRALLPAGPRHVSGAGRLRHGPHVPDGVRRLVGRAAASAGRHRTGAQPRPGARRPRRRAPLAGERANRIRLRRRRPPGPAPGRHGRRPQLHPHHHGPGLRGAHHAHRSGVRPRRRLDAGRWRARDGRLHRHRHLVAVVRSRAPSTPRASPQRSPQPRSSRCSPLRWERRSRGLAPDPSTPAM